MTKTWSKLKLNMFLWHIARVREGTCMALKFCEQSYKTITSHIMVEGPADIGFSFDSALSDEHQLCAKQY